MIEILKGLLGKISRMRQATKHTPITLPKRPKGSGDFRAVEISPSIMCCPAAMQVTGRSYLLREAPRLPL